MSIHILSTISNAVPCAFWAIIHICRDRTLLSQIHDELRSSLHAAPPSKLPLPTSTTESEDGPFKEDSLLESESLMTAASLPLHSVFHINSLSDQPLLQSVYAEILRLYVRGFITRCPERSDLRINEWLIPKEKVILVSSDPAHFDPQVWNTANGLFPLTTFWPERFLVRKDAHRDILPRKTAPPLVAEDNLTPQETQLEPGHSSLATPDIDTKMPRKFTLNGLHGSWIPYGGGSRACPGRHFAKQEILMTVAMMLTAFDIEPLGDEKAFGAADMVLERRYLLGGSRLGSGGLDDGGKESRL